MATVARVLAFFEECEVAKNFTAVTQGMVNSVAQQHADNGDLEAQEIALDQGALYEHIQGKLLNKLAGIYCNLYTDEQIDQLTMVFHLPISQHSREILPEMQRQLASTVIGMQEEMAGFMLKREFGKLVDQVLA